MSLSPVTYTLSIASIATNNTYGELVLHPVSKTQFKKRAFWWQPSALGARLDREAKVRANDRRNDAMRAEERGDTTEPTRKKIIPERRCLFKIYIVTFYRKAFYRIAFRQSMSPHAAHCDCELFDAFYYFPLFSLLNVS